MDIATVTYLLKNCVKFIIRYRETGYQNALCAARELADSLEVDPIFKETRFRRRRKHFDYESNDNISETSEEKYKRESFIHL